MKKISVIYVLLLALSLFVLGKAETAPWSDVKERLTGGTGYSLRCDYAGPEGVFAFRYIVKDKGQKIFTEVLEGSSRGSGTRIYYDIEEDSKNVTMQTSLFRLRRSLEARDIKDTPLYVPLFTHLMGEFSTSDPTPQEGTEPGTTVFLFGDEKTLHERFTVDEKGDPLSLKRMEGPKEINSLTFTELEWGDRPIDW